MGDKNPTFETEGDVREYVEENPEDAVYTELPRKGGVWFSYDDEDGFRVTLDPHGCDVREGPILGDGRKFQLQYTEREVREADDVPSVS